MLEEREGACKISFLTFSMEIMDIMEQSAEDERDSVIAVVDRVCTDDAMQDVFDMFEHITSSPFEFSSDAEHRAAVVLFGKRRIMLFSRMMQKDLAPESLGNLVYLAYFACNLGMKDIFAYMVDVCSDDDLRYAMQRIFDDEGELDDDWNITTRSSTIKGEVENGE